MSVLAGFVGGVLGAALLGTVREWRGEARWRQWARAEFARRWHALRWVGLPSGGNVRGRRRG